MSKPNKEVGSMILFKNGTGCTAVVTEVTSHNGILSFDTTTLCGARGREMELDIEDQLKLVRVLHRHAETGKLDKEDAIDE